MASGARNVPTLGFPGKSKYPGHALAFIALACPSSAGAMSAEFVRRLVGSFANVQFTRLLPSLCGSMFAPSNRQPPSRGLQMSSRRPARRHAANWRLRPTAALSFLVRAADSSWTERDAALTADGQGSRAPHDRPAPGNGADVDGRSPRHAKRASSSSVKPARRRASRLKGPLSTGAR